MRGDSSYGNISDLAVEAVKAAVVSVQRFCADVYDQSPQSTIDKPLVDQWCISSFEPECWNLPSKWNAFSQAYRTSDGWVRIHCNAPHHRKSAIDVLGGVDTPELAHQSALRWNANELVEAIAAAGGCSARLLTSDEWRSHPQGKAVAREPLVAWERRSHCAQKWNSGTPASPFRGLKVLDLTRIIAGPVSTRFLASLGADVLRIDPPGWSEGMTEIEMSVGKSCAQLDLHEKTDRATFEELLRKSDILVHGYRKDALDRLGYNEITLSTLNPALIKVGLTAYGWTGPWSNRRGFDSLVQHSTGLAVERDEKIISLPFQVLDHATGYLMAAAMVEALRLQITEKTVSNARLSLARQAQLLLDAKRKGSDVFGADQHHRLGHAAKKDGTRELTDWGPGWRYPLPYSMKGIHLQWSRPAHRFGTDSARFLTL